MSRQLPIVGSSDSEENVRVPFTHILATSLLSHTSQETQQPVTGGTHRTLSHITSRLTEIDPLPLSARGAFADLAPPSTVELD